MTQQFHSSIYPTENQARNKNMNVYVNTTHISPWHHKNESHRSPTMRNLTKCLTRLCSESITAFPLAPHFPQALSASDWSRPIPAEQGTLINGKWLKDSLLQTALEMHYSLKMFPESPSFLSPFLLHNHQIYVGLVALNKCQSNLNLLSCSWGTRTNPTSINRKTN